MSRRPAYQPNQVFNSEVVWYVSMLGLNPRKPRTQDVVVVCGWVVQEQNQDTIAWKVWFSVVKGKLQERGKQWVVNLMAFLCQVAWPLWKSRGHSYNGFRRIGDRLVGCWHTAYRSITRWSCKSAFFKGSLSVLCVFRGSLNVLCKSPHMYIHWSYLMLFT